MLDRREETLVAKTKRYGQAVQYALTTMPTEVGDLPSWFNMVENVWSKFEVPVDHFKTHFTCQIFDYTFVS